MFEGLGSKLLALLGGGSVAAAKGGRMSAAAPARAKVAASGAGKTKSRSKPRPKPRTHPIPMTPERADLIRNAMKIHRAKQRILDDLSDEHRQKLVAMAMRAFLNEARDLPAARPAAPPDRLRTMAPAKGEGTRDTPRTPAGGPARPAGGRPRGG